jgi:hypothetical protein
MRNGGGDGRADIHDRRCSRTSGLDPIRRKRTSRSPPRRPRWIRRARWAERLHGDIATLFPKDDARAPFDESLTPSTEAQAIRCSCHDASVFLRRSCCSSSELPPAIALANCGGKGDALERAHEMSAARQILTAKRNSRCRPQKDTDDPTATWQLGMFAVQINC